ncbi:unnamed protein product [Allacma fusca]|uniref:Uncharacterized protein n=1 Tax=Allacma fusca TaxID=39272 RepID=A0A8J2J5D2_9HEXA|nr:unnamed protein product [Allacma fusca]
MQCVGIYISILYMLCTYNVFLDRGRKFWKTLCRQLLGLCRYIYSSRNILSGSVYHGKEGKDKHEESFRSICIKLKTFPKTMAHSLLPCRQNLRNREQNLTMEPKTPELLEA